MQSGDGLSDVALAVCVVAGPEEQHKRSGSGSCCLFVVLCAMRLFLLLFVSREYPYHRARAHDPPGATKDTGTPPRHIHSSRTQDFRTKRILTMY